MALYSPPHYTTPHPPQLKTLTTLTTPPYTGGAHPEQVPSQVPLLQRRHPRHRLRYLGWPHRLGPAGTLPGYHPCCVTLTHLSLPLCTHHTLHTLHTHHSHATGGADPCGPHYTSLHSTPTLQAGQTLADLSFLCAGAGSAGLGVCEQIVDGMVEAGLTKEEARARFVVCTSVGALGKADGTHGEPPTPLAPAPTPTLSPTPSPTLALSPNPNRHQVTPTPLGA